jgi:hypothetical protein
MWLSLTLKKEALLSVFGHTVSVPLSQLADGCVGVLLAFETREQAEEHSEDIIEFTFKRVEKEE